jgi:hypothetical protein
VYPAGGFALAAVAVASLALLRPAMLRPLYVLLTAITFPIGLVVSNVLVLAVYYVAIVPLGLVLRLVGWDPMHRAFDRASKSYWVPRKSDKVAATYFNQY